MFFLVYKFNHVYACHIYTPLYVNSTTFYYVYTLLYVHSTIYILYRVYTPLYIHSILCIFQREYNFNICVALHIYVPPYIYLFQVYILLYICLYKVYILVYRHLTIHKLYHIYIALYVYILYFMCLYMLFCIENNLTCAQFS